MSGGPGQQQNSVPQPSWHITLRNGALITPEQYRQNQQQIANAREYLAQVERQNEEAHRRFMLAEQQLRERVEQGREAERILAQLQAHPQAQHGQPSSHPAYSPASWSQAALPVGYPTAPGASAAYGSANAARLDATATRHHQAHHVNGTMPVHQSQQTGRTANQPTSGAQPYGYVVENAYRTPYQSSSSSSTPTHPSQGQPGAASRQHPVTQISGRPQHGHTHNAQPVASTSRQPLHFVPYHGSQLAQAPTQVRLEPTPHAYHAAQDQAGRVSAVVRTTSGRPVAANTSESTLQAAQSPDPAVQRAIENDVRAAVQPLSIENVRLVLRLIINKLRARMVRNDGQQVQINPLDGVEIEPDLRRIGEGLADKMKVLTGPAIVHILHRVQQDIIKPPTQSPSVSPAQTVNGVTATAAPTNVPQPIAKPAPADSSVNGVGSVPTQDGAPQQSVRSSIARHPEQENVPSVAFADLQRQPQTPQGSSRPSILTPDQADKSRLARDILRSLGRPSAQTLAQMSPATKSTEDDGGANAKRKRALSGTKPADKRQKLDDEPGVSPSPQPVVDASGAAPIDTSAPPAIDVAIQSVSEAPAPRVSSENDVPAEVRPSPSAQTNEEAVEIRTHGAMELALSEALQSSSVPEEVQQPNALVSDVLVSTIAIGPLPILNEPTPTTRSPSPPTYPALNDLSDQIRSSSLNEPFSAVPLPPPTTFSDSSSAPATPGAGPSRQPLFYVSPDSPHNNIGTNLDLVGGLVDFVPSGLLAEPQSSPSSKGKGKQRVYEVDSDIEILDAPPAPPSPKKGKQRRRDSEMEIVEPSDADELADFRNLSIRRPKAQVYVLVPPPSARLQKIWASQKKRTPRVSNRRVLSSSESSDEDVDEIAEDFRDDETQRKEDAEARAVHDLCYNQLHPSRCQWEGCDAVLESAKQLGLHAKLHAEEYDDDDEIVSCLWAGCPRDYKKKHQLAHHVQKHSLHPVVCAYDGCDFECWSNHDMVKHYNQPKHRGQPLKPQAVLVPPDPSSSLPPLPDLMPAYMAADLVLPASISQARHATLGPKVLRNISTSTPFGEVDKSAALRTPRRPKLSDKPTPRVDADEGRSDDRTHTAGPYDHWLQPRTTRVRRICDDIPSRAVTRMFAGGLAIEEDWLVRGEPDWHPDWHEEDADGETDHGEDISFEVQEVKPNDDVLPVLDVEMQSASQSHPDLTEAGSAQT